MSRDALVVGINTYDRLNPLRSPAEDAEEIAKILANYGDFTVHRLPAIADTTHNTLQVGRKTPVTLETLRQALAQLFKPKSRQYPDTALFYFSGHGLRDDVGIQQGYLATSDVNPDRGIYGLPLWWLRQLLEESPVQQQAIWLDCCHSGELLNFAQANPEERGRGRDRSFIAACRDFGEAFEAPGDRYSILTQALLAGLDPASQPERRVTNLHLVASLSPHFQGEPQQPVFINSGGPILLTRSGQVSAPPAIVEDGALCPYKGLAYFDYNNDDPNYFHGRRALTDELLGKLRQGNFLAILGASGSGKSSVLRAGLLHQLQRGQQLSGSDQWPIYLFNPGEHPLQSLAEVFLETDDLSTIERADQLRKAQDFVNAGAVGLGKLIDAALRKTAAKRVVLAIDQFEECFTLCGDSAERQQFFECVLGTLDRPGDQLRLVLVMRVDFLKKCLEQDYAGLAKKIQNNLVAVTSMNRQELEQAITAPAKQVGLEIETGLVDQMRVDVGSALGSLPLLQFALTELWKRRTATHLTFAAYHKLGSLRGALEQQAEEAYTSLSQEEQDVAKRIFLALIQPGQGTEDTSRQAFQQELVALHRSEAVVIRVIQKLATARLIVTSVLKPKSPGDQKNVVDIAHEALIRHWSRLRQWIQDNRDALRQKQQIEAAAEEWQAQGQTTQVEFLLQGSKLAVALEFARDYGDRIPLSQLAQEFVRVSGEERDRITQAEAQRQQRELQQERKFRIISLGFAGFTTVATIGLSMLVHTLMQQQISLMVELSKSELLRNQQLEALTASVKAGRQLKWTPLVSPEIRIKTLIALNKAIYDTQEINRLERHTDAVSSVSFSSKHCNSSTQKKEDDVILVSVSNDGTIRLWQSNGRPLPDPHQPSEKHSQKITSISTSCDGQIFASSSNDGTIKLWQRNDGTLLQTLPIQNRNEKNNKPHQIHRVSFGYKGQRLAAAIDYKIIRFWTLKDRKYRFLEEIISNLNDISFSPTDEILASADSKGTVWLWDSRTYKKLGPLPGHKKSPVNNLSFSPNGKVLAAADKFGNIRLWNVNNRTLLSIKEDAHQESVNSVAFNAHGTLLASASGDRTIKLWPIMEDEDERIVLRQGKKPHILRGHTDSVLSVSFSPTRKIVASASADKTVRLWKTEPEPERHFDLPEKSDCHGISTMDFSPDSQHIVITCNKTMMLWTPKTGEITEPFQSNSPEQEHNGKISSIAFSPDKRPDDRSKDQLMVSASDDGKVKLWKLIKRPQPNGIFVGDLEKPTSDPEAPQPKFTSVHFSPNGQFIVAGTDDGRILLWKRNGNNASDWDLQAPGYWDLHKKRIMSVRFSPKNQRLVSASYDGTIKVWKPKDTGSAEKVKTSQKKQKRFNSAHFSSNGERIVSVSNNNTVNLWWRDGAFIKTLEEHNTAIVTSASFSPDPQMAQMVASVDSKGSVKFWDLEGNLLETLQLKHNDASIYNLRFSSNGKQLALFSDKAITIWNLNLDTLLEKACERLRDYLQSHENLARSICHL